MAKEYHFQVLEDVSINGILFRKGTIVARTEKDFVDQLSKSKATKNLTEPDAKPRTDNRSG